jgi:hypothetical protein
MRHRRIVELIHRHQANNVITFDVQNGRTVLTGNLPRGASGLYWFWTSYSIEELANCTRPHQLTGEVNISQLAIERNVLEYICQVTSNEFRVVYNGKGGSTTNGYGLRERILQEIRGQEGTGSLSILNSSVNDHARWQITYLDFENEAFLNELGEDISYQNEGETFEMLWRLHFGWPILCRR